MWKQLKLHSAEAETSTSCGFLKNSIPPVNRHLRPQSKFLTFSSNPYFIFYIEDSLIRCLCPNVPRSFSFPVQTRCYVLVRSSDFESTENVTRDFVAWLVDCHNALSSSSTSGGRDKSRSIKITVRMNKTEETGERKSGRRRKWINDNVEHCRRVETRT